MKKIKIRFSGWTVPLILLFETAAAYGLLIIFQGFYFDDWQVLWLNKTNADFWAFYAYDRPFSAWTYILTFPLLGTSALRWHIFNLLLRWITSWLAWWVLRLIWPQRQKEVTLIAILFGVYPAFTQQAISIAYSQHLTTYILFLASLGLMLISLQKEKWARWGLIGLALIAQGLHLFTMEYFWGLELIRPLVIYFVLERVVKDRRDLFRQTLKTLIPYLLIFVSTIFWRLFIYAPIDDPNALRWLSMLFDEPIKAIIHLVEMVLGDLLFLMIATWFDTLRVELIDLDSMFLVASWGIVIFVGTILYFYVRNLKQSDVDSDDSIKSKSQMAILGLLVMLLGPLPVWLTNKQIIAGRFSDRFALAAMLGASILLVVIFELILSKRLMLVVLVCALAGLATGSHVRIANEYRWAWTKQRRFYWQLKWRVPQLESGTAIFSDGGIFTYTGDYPVSFALGLLYQAENELETTQPPYWFFELDSGFNYYQKYFLRGHELHGKLRNIAFDGWSTDSIIIDYDPDQGSCLWVVGEGDELVETLPDLTRSALPMADLSRISLPETDDGEMGIPALFGDAPPHTWCYYFQKAELARQFGDWERVVELAKEVDRQQFSPQNRFEWRPFVDAYLHLGEYQSAYANTTQAFQADDDTGEMFCSLWRSTLDQNPGDTKLADFTARVVGELDCPE